MAAHNAIVEAGEGQFLSGLPVDALEKRGVMQNMTTRSLLSDNIFLGIPMASVRPIVSYACVYAVGFATFSWYDVPVYGFERDIVAWAGILVCLALVAILRKHGLKPWLCIPAIVLASWEYLVWVFMMVVWSIIGFSL